VQSLQSEENTYLEALEKLPEKGISNLRECLFRIAPEINFEFHREYKNMLRNYEQISKQINKSKDESESTE